MALIVVLTLLAAAMLAPGLLIGPSLDAAVFTDVGGRLLHGVAPYLAAWDHKPPGIYLVTAAVQGILGWLGPWTAAWLLSLAASVGIGMAVATVLSRLDVIGWPRSLAAIGTTLFASHYLLALGGGLTEAPATLPVAWGFVLALRPATSARTAVAMGVLVGLSIMLSFQLLPGGLAVLGLALFRWPASARPRVAALLGLGFAAPLIVTGVWLLLIGAMPAAVDAVVAYSTAYRSSGNDFGATLAAPVAAWTVLVSLFLVAPALLGAPLARTAAQPGRGVAIASLLWVAVSLLAIVFQGRFYAHYAIPLAVPFGILAGLGLHRVGQSVRRASRSSSKAVILVTLTATFLLSVVASVVSAAMQMAPIADADTRMHAVAERLRDLPAGTMLVWGNQPRLYSLADRAPATRYSYLYPLTTPTYSTSAQIEQVARALMNHPPAIVVDVGSSAPGQPGFLPLLLGRPIATDGRDLDLLDPLRAFVAARYQLVETVSGWPIYALKR